MALAEAVTLLSATITDEINLIFSGPEWFGSLHHMDIHRLSDQLVIGSPPVGYGQEHSCNRLPMHPVCRVGGMVSSARTRLNDEWGFFQGEK